MREATPEFADLLRPARARRAAVAQEEVRLRRRGASATCWCGWRPAQSGEGKLEGYVVAFDDVTDLVVAQRMAAWGDVARRIAHEIKNPLTPDPAVGRAHQAQVRAAGRRPARRRSSSTPT